MQFYTRRVIHVLLYLLQFQLGIECPETIRTSLEPVRRQAVLAGGAYKSTEADPRNTRIWELLPAAMFAGCGLAECFGAENVREMELSR